MVGSYIRRATAVPVWNCSPKKLLRGPERPEQYLVTLVVQLV